MHADKFDSVFREKLNGLGQYPEPVWDKSRVWNKIEAKPPQKIGVFWWAAASVLFLLGTFLFLPENQNETPTTKLNLKTKPNIEISETESKKNVEKIKRKKARKINLLEEVPINPIQLLPELPKQELLAEIKVDTLPTKKESLPELKQDNLVQLAQEVKPKADTSRVLVLNIPVDEEDIQPRKKRWIGRVAQQVARASQGKGFDWEEVNIRPRRIWVFVRNSFKEEPDTSNKIK